MPRACALNRWYGAFGGGGKALPMGSDLWRRVSVGLHKKNVLEGHAQGRDHVHNPRQQGKTQGRPSASSQRHSGGCLTTRAAKCRKRDQESMRCHFCRRVCAAASDDDEAASGASICLAHRHDANAPAFGLMAAISPLHQTWARHAYSQEPPVQAHSGLARASRPRRHPDAAGARTAHHVRRGAGCQRA